MTSVGFPPHQGDDLPELLAEARHQFARDNGLGALRILRQARDLYPWAKEAADLYGLIVSRHHHLHSRVAAYRLHEWMALHQAKEQAPYRVDMNVRRMALMTKIIRDWLAERSTEQWAHLADIGGQMGEMSIHWAGLPGIHYCFVCELSHTNCKGGHNFHYDPRIHFLSCFADKLPLRSQSMDIAVLSGILEHVLNPDILVREAHRVLKPGGLVVIQVPYGGMEIPNPDAEKWGFRGHVSTVDPFKYTKGHKVVAGHYIRETSNAYLPHSFFGEIGDYVVAYTV